FIPGQNRIEPLTLKLTRADHSPAAKTFPQHTDLPSGNRYHHMRVEHDRHECRDHQVDHDAREMALNEPPPPRWCRRRRRCPIYRPQIYFHHLFSTVYRATKRSSSIRKPASGLDVLGSKSGPRRSQSRLSLAETRPSAVSRGPARPAAPASPTAAPAPRSAARPHHQATL